MSPLAEFGCVGGVCRCEVVGKFGHWGGRYIWQLSTNGETLVAWKETPSADPDTVEATLIIAFEQRFGALPFANLRRWKLGGHHSVERA